MKCIVVRSLYKLPVGFSVLSPSMYIFLFLQNLQGKFNHTIYEKNNLEGKTMIVGKLPKTVPMVL